MTKTRKKQLLGGIASAFVLGSLFTCYVMGPGRVIREVTLNSPDGEYQINVREERRLHTFTNWGIAVRLSRMSQDGGWIEIDRAKEGSDSLVSHSISVDWSYSQRYRTTGVEVFANYGPPPSEPKVIYHKNLP
jgi:hypothetical protein